jgi:hypothetical protein
MCFSLGLIKVPDKITWRMFNDVIWSESHEDLGTHQKIEDKTNKAQHRYFDLWDCIKYTVDAAACRKLKTIMMKQSMNGQSIKVKKNE